MSNKNSLKGIDFSKVNPRQIHRLVKDLYKNHPDDKRDCLADLIAGRRQVDRRTMGKKVLLDTRTSRSRRQSSGRRQRDEIEDNQHKVGIDYYV